MELKDLPSARRMLTTSDSSSKLTIVASIFRTPSELVKVLDQTESPEESTARTTINIFIINTLRESPTFRQTPRRYFLSCREGKPCIQCALTPNPQLTSCPYEYYSLFIPCAPCILSDFGCQGFALWKQTQRHSDDHRRSRIRTDR